MGAFNTGLKPVILYCPTGDGADITVSDTVTTALDTSLRPAAFM
jgi:hypothetical protein